jgi:MFS family permease
MNDYHILWRQVWGLAALVAAIVFSWMAYGFCQPEILTQLGFVSLSQNLGIIQGLIGAVIEPVVGMVADRVLRKVGSRLPVLIVGVTLAGSIFVLVGYLLSRELPQVIRWVIPLLMTVWTIAMIIFRGPAIAMLRQFAPTQALPQANAILTIVFGLVGALGPIFGLVIRYVGMVATFALGAVVLALGLGLMWSSRPQLVIAVQQPRTEIPADRSLRRTMSIFGVGVGAGLLVNLLLRFCPTLWHQSIPTLTPEYIAAIVLLISALTAVPLERLIADWGLQKSMAISLLAIATTIGLGLLHPWSFFAFWLILAAGIEMGLLLIAQIPWCLGLLPPSQAGIATGCYFGGMGAATAIGSLLLTTNTPIQTYQVAIWTLAAIAIALYFLSRYNHDSLTVNHE